MYNISLLGTQTRLLQKAVEKHQAEAQQNRCVSTNSHGEDISHAPDYRQIHPHTIRIIILVLFILYRFDTAPCLISTSNPAKLMLQLIHHHLICILETYRVRNIYFTHCVRLTKTGATTSLLLPDLHPGDLPSVQCYPTQLILLTESY